MSNSKYVAYVGSYTHGKAKGITICDVDVEKGIFIPRKEVEVGNPSYLRIANNGKFLYSVSDLGITAFKILPDGDLEFINLVIDYAILLIVVIIVAIQHNRQHRR